MAMYPVDVTLMDEAFDYISEAVSSPSKITAKPLGKEHLETITQILERWPASSRFPGAFCSLYLLYSGPITRAD